MLSAEDQNKLMLELAEKLFKAEKPNIAAAAEIVLERHKDKLAPIVYMLLPGVAQLLADVQKTSFIHGSVATSFALAQQAEAEAIEQMEEAMQKAQQKEGKPN